MKIILTVLFTLAAMSFGPVAFADYWGMLIGSRVEQNCDLQARKANVNPVTDAWRTQCRQLAQEQDACVLATGYTTGAKPTAATDACWRQFEAKVRAIPR
jgi:hypothetical protein